MAQESFTHWLKKHLNTVVKDARAIKPCMHPEQIHSFRTGIKRLQAMLELVAEIKDEKEKLPKAFRKFYHATGELRDLQVLLQIVMAENTFPLPTFAVWLSYKIGAAAHHLAHMNGGRAVDELEEMNFGASINDLDDSDIDTFFLKRLQVIKSLSSQKPDDEVLHEIRKRSKGMQYVLAASKNIWPASHAKWAPLLEARLRELSERAGRYNDLRNLSDVLAQYEDDYDEVLTKEDRRAQEGAKREWIKQKDAERRALLITVEALADAA